MTARDRFADRQSAGRAVAARLVRFGHRSDVVVLGLPRGGIVIAAAVADALVAPLDVVVVRKLGAPGREELAMGALAVWGDAVHVTRNGDVLRQLAIGADAFEAARTRELAVARRRATEWCQARPLIQQRTVILVDDGLATGATLRAAVEVVREAGAGRIVVALPVAPGRELGRIGQLVDEIECVLVPDNFGAVAAHYDDFAQVDDATVRDLLARAAHRNG